MKSNINALSVKDVARIFDVPKFTVRKWARSGDLPAKKIGKRWFFEERVIHDYLENK